MEPGDITDLAKTGGNSSAGFIIGHLTGNDIITILTIAYLIVQLIIAAPKLYGTIKRWLQRGKNGKSDTGRTQ